MWAVLVGLLGAAITTGLFWYVEGSIGDKREKGGRLDTARALAALDSCRPSSFDKTELKARRKLNKEVDRLAATIEAIPKNTGSYDPSLIEETRRRGASLRKMHYDVATLTDDSKARLRERLISLKRAYDSGRWADLPAADLSIVSRPTLLAVRLSFGVLAAVCLGGIVYMLIVPTHLPTGGVSILTFILGTLGLGFLSRAGLLTPTSQQVIELMTKAQGAVKPGAAEDAAEKTNNHAGDGPHASK